MTPPKINPDLDLTIDRVIGGSPETIWRCWSEPDLFRRWFTPPGVDVVEVENDLRPGGRAYNVMRLPDGTLMPNDGCFLLAEPFTRLVFTDGFRAGFRPANDPAFLVADIRLTPVEGGTLYAAHVMHSEASKREAHEEMGFHDGWGTTLAQLDALVQEVGAV